LLDRPQRIAMIRFLPVGVQSVALFEPIKEPLTLPL
jgi:hypothetical protein